MKKNTRIIDIIVSIGVAFLIWSYVVNVINPPSKTTVHDVPVILTSEEVLASSRLALSETSGQYTVDVVLSGTRSELAGIKAEQITATADLFGLGVGQNYVNVKVTAPGNIDVNETKPSRIGIVIENLVSVSKPVKLEIGNCPEGYEVTLFDSGAVRLAVSGAKTQVDKVTTLYAKLKTDQLRNDIPTTLLLELSPLDIDGEEVPGVKLADNYIEVTGTIYALKEVPLIIPTTGNPGMNADSFTVDGPKTVLIKGPKSALEETDKLVADTINIEGITASKNYTLSISTPDNIHLSNTVKDLSASAMPGGNAYIETKIAAEKITVSGRSASFTYEYELPEEITVRASGSFKYIKELDPQLLDAVLDLSSINEEGTFDIPFVPGKSLQGITTAYDAGTVSVTAVRVEEETPEENGTDAGNETAEENGTDSGNETAGENGTDTGNETSGENSTDTGNETAAD